MLLTLLAAAVTPFPIAAGDSDMVVVRTEELEDGSYVFYADNLHVVPVYVRIEVPQIINMQSDRELPVAVGLEAGERNVRVFTLSPTSRTGRRGYSLQYSHAMGNPETADHDDSYAYLLPFAHGAKHRLSQGFHGIFSHYDDNEYAVDFEMDIGTAIYAARAGVVAEVKEDSRIGGTSATYASHANRLLVAHGDGSFGNYVHLVVDGAVVEPGDRVEAGQLIGYSGNTGMSSGPHLHFDVRVPTFEGTMQSIPFLLRGRDGEAMAPEEGAFYYAYHPGGAPFEEELGSDISLASYENYREPYTVSDTLQTRVEQVDLTFLVFVQNGYGDDIDVELTFALTGLESDAGASVEVTAPARSEVLATILRPRPGATSIAYSYSIRYWR